MNFIIAVIISTEIFHYRINTTRKSCVNSDKTIWNYAFFLSTVVRRGGFEKPADDDK